MGSVCMPCMITEVENTCVMYSVLNLTFHSCAGVPTVKEKGFTYHLCIFDVKAVWLKPNLLKSFFLIVYEDAPSFIDVVKDCCKIIFLFL